jgi:hypothetical protein
MNPTGLAEPLINGVQYDYSSLEVKVRGKPILGRAFTAVSYKESLKPGKVRAGHPQALGRTRGEYDAEGSLEVPKTHLHTFLKELCGEAAVQGMAAGAIAGSVSAGNVTIGYLESSFLLTVSYGDIGQASQEDTLVGCKITDIDENHKAGPDGLMVSLSLDIAYILRNKLPPMGSAMIR